MSFFKRAWTGTKTYYGGQRKFKKDVRQAAKEAYEKEYKKQAIIAAQRRASLAFRPRQLPLEQFMYDMPKPLKIKHKVKHRRKRKKRK